MNIVEGNKESLYEALEREFESTLIKELIPGVLHNFANPLNGIMGRSKLLQRRMEEYFHKVEDYCPDLVRETADDQDKLSRDVKSICNESDRFFYMFQDLASKFYAITDKRIEQINVTNLIRNELRFLEFYLDFKHEIKKDIKLNNDLPCIYGIQAGYSLCFSALLRNCMHRMKRSEKKELSIITDYRDGKIAVVIQDTGEKIDTGSDSAEEWGGFPPGGCYMSSLSSVQLLLNEYHSKCTFESETDRNRITVEIPGEEKDLPRSDKRESPSVN